MRLYSLMPFLSVSRHLRLVALSSRTATFGHLGRRDGRVHFQTGGHRFAQALSWTLAMDGMTPEDRQLTLLQLFTSPKSPTIQCPLIRALRLLRICSLPEDGPNHSLGLSRWTL
jgi:hypothetical protein